MANNLGPMELSCDAPPYSIIEASVRVGIRNPEDVRWCRISQFLSDDISPSEGANVFAWKSFFSPVGVPRINKCFCRGALPRLEKCTFTFLSGKEESYSIGQCPRCRTIFWDEA